MGPPWQRMASTIAATNIDPYPYHQQYLEETCGPIAYLAWSMLREGLWSNWDKERIRVGTSEWMASC